MRDPNKDKPKSIVQLNNDLNKICAVEGCDCHITQMQGPGCEVLCRDHQLFLTEYGGMGRIDRLHTFHRTWECSKCHYEPLKDPRVNIEEDMDIRYRIARTLMHGDHILRAADGGNDTAENIDGLCVTCHTIKTIKNQDYLKGSKNKDLLT